MRGLVGLLVVVLLLAAFVYGVLPRLIEDQLAATLQQELGLDSAPEVEITSSFPPELLLGRMDSVQVTAEQATLQGIPLGGARADLTDVEVSVPSLLRGDLAVGASGCSLTAREPAVTVDDDAECLAYLGLGGA